MRDYLVVGLGLAGVSFCETLERNNKTFTVISDGSQTSSLVAGGLYNPVILKRFTLSWKAREQLDVSIPFYGEMEKKLGVKLDYKVPVLRRFASIEEQNLWFEAADKPVLSPFLSIDTVPNENPALDAPYGFGQVLGTGRIDTEILISAYNDYLQEKGILIKETLDYDALNSSSSGVEYKSINAKHIIFAEGYGLKQNPYFNYLPLNGTKGELLTIRASELLEESVIKSSVFIIPLVNHCYRVGATYKWKDKSNIPTRVAKSELLEKLDGFLKCSYEVVAHVAGIRPTVSDRRPLVGRHPKYNHMYLLNGFGSRGVMIAPYASVQLYLFIENGTAIDPEMDCARFAKMFGDN